MQVEGDKDRAVRPDGLPHRLDEIALGVFMAFRDHRAVEGEKESGGDGRGIFTSSCGLSFEIRDRLKHRAFRKVVNVLRDRRARLRVQREERPVLVFRQRVDHVEEGRELHFRFPEVFPDIFLSENELALFKVFPGGNGPEITVALQFELAGQNRLHVQNPPELLLLLLLRLRRFRSRGKFLPSPEVHDDEHEHVIDGQEPQGNERHREGPRGQADEHQKRRA